MAYAALLSLSNTIDFILSYNQDAISPPAKDQIISIAEYAIFFQAFLEDSPEEARRFEAIVTAVTHAAEDIVEGFISSHIYEPRCASLNSPIDQYRILSDFPEKAQSLEVFISEARKTKDIPSIFEFLTRSESKDQQSRGECKHFRYNFEELKEAKEEFESIAEIVMKFKNSIATNDIHRENITTTGSYSKLASSQTEAVVGLDDDLLHIKSLLYRESNALEVVPIVGMGGIGKTMLARNVYNDEFSMQHFDICAWVTVSQDCNVTVIVSSLLESLKVFADEADEVKRRLLVFQTLKCRRFLIVLDDIWSTDVWNELKLMFPDDGNKSRIVLTTRLQDVAGYADSCSLIHNMHFLNEDHSWRLLKQTLFKQDSCPIKLEKIGKVIARRCRGLPLAIVVIAGILSNIEQTEATWYMIARNVKSTVCTNEEQISKILSLSYVHLPRHLRTCFLYIAGFPEDYKIRVTRLIRLWIAEGFLKPNGLKKSFEETAQEYVDDLVKRSLVLVVKRGSDGQIAGLSMHDLVREMCIMKAQQENFLHRFLRETRKTPLFVSASPSGEVNIRTTRYLHGIQLLGSLGYYRLLRILDLENYFKLDFDPKLPPEICELFHLRYLAFCSQFRIPPGISNLQNLQTFIMSSTPDENNYVYNAISFPFLMEIWSMPQLRHLCICISFIFCIPRFREGESFALANLQTLTRAVNFTCTPDIARAIPNVKKLAILLIVRDGYEEDYQLKNLMLLQQLENLKLEMQIAFPCPEKLKPAFPLTLKKLTLLGLKLPWEDLRIVGSLPNLEVLKLRRASYLGDTWETSEGEFSRLKFLLIDHTKLRNWITESSHFPRLQCLVIYRCQYLYEIPDEFGYIPTLEFIEVEGRYESMVESAKQIRANQQECGNDALRVRIVKTLPC